MDSESYFLGNHKVKINMECCFPRSLIRRSAPEEIKAASLCRRDTQAPIVQERVTLPFSLTLKQLSFWQPMILENKFLSLYVLGGKKAVFGDSH